MKYSSRSSTIASTSPYILTAIHYGYDSKAVCSLDSPVSVHCTLWRLNSKRIKKKKERNHGTFNRENQKSNEDKSNRNGLCVCVCVILALEK